MNKSSFKYMVAAVAVLSFLAGACGKSGDKPSMSYKGRGGHDKTKKDDDDTSKKLDDSDLDDETDKEETAEEKKVKEEAQDSLSKEFINDEKAVEGTKISSDEFDKDIKEILDADAVLVEDLPLGTYKLSEINASLQQTLDSSKVFKGIMSLSLSKEGSLSEIDTDFQNNDNTLETSDSKYMDDYVFKSFKVEKSDDKHVIKKESSERFLFGSRFMDGKKSRYSILTSGDHSAAESFDIVDFLAGSDKTKSGDHYAGPIRSNDDRKIEHFVHVKKIDDSTYALVLSRDTYDKKEQTTVRIRILQLIYKFEKATETEEEKKKEDEIKSPSDAADAAPFSSDDVE